MKGEEREKQKGEGRRRRLWFEASPRILVIGGICNQSLLFWEIKESEST